MKLLLCLLALLTVSTTHALEEKLRRDIFSSSQVQPHFERWLKGGDLITPAATWVLILEMRIKERERGCLFYRAPFEKSRGELRYYKGADCDQNYDRAQSVLTGVGKINLTFRPLESRFILEFIQQEKPFEWSYLFPSYKSPRGLDQLLGDGTGESKLRYLSLEEGAQAPQMRGAFSDNYRDNSAILCEAVAPNCERGENTCASCAFGSYAVVDHHCPQGGSRYCGVNRCGEQGQPACPRGEGAATRALPAGEILSWCAKDSTAGFCQQGLMTSCDGKGVLICL